MVTRRSHAMNGEKQIIENAHAREERRGLKRPGDPKMGPFMDRQAGDISPHKIDVARIS